MAGSPQTSFQQKVAARQEGRVCFDLGHRLNMRPRAGISSYHVAITYTRKGEGARPTRLDYTVDHEVLYRLEEMRFIVGISKYDFFINRRQPAMIMEEIAGCIAEAINPIQVIINHTGAVQKIYNMAKILDRWKKCRTALRKEYQGAVIDQTFAQLDKKFSHPVAFEGALTGDVFWNLFFTPLYVRYGEGKKRDMKLLLPLATGAPAALFKGSCMVDPLLTAHNSVALTYEATATMPGPLLGSGKSNTDSLEAHLQVTYDLDAKTHLPRLIRATCRAAKTETGARVKTIDVLISRTWKPDSRASKKKNWCDDG